MVLCQSQPKPRTEDFLAVAATCEVLSYDKRVGDWLPCGSPNREMLEVAVKVLADSRFVKPWFYIESSMCWSIFLRLSESEGKHWSQDNAALVYHPKYRQPYVSSNSVDLVAFESLDQIAELLATENKAWHKL